MARYDIAVVGATPGGIAAAVRAAREGNETVLITYNDHLGGMMAGGLSYTDTLTMKARTPILEEFVGAIHEHYRTEYGSGSEQVEYCENGYVFEPHVAEEVFDTIVEAESHIDIQWGYYPTCVKRSGASIETVEFASFETEEDLTIEATVFLEGTYEGDLMAEAGVPYRVGRESRSEFDEQFAGRLFTQARGDRYYPRPAVGNDDTSAPADRRGPFHVPPKKQQGELDLIPHPAGLTEVFAGSTGEGDDAIQAYNYRLCLSRDPENRRLPAKPQNYDRKDHFEALEEIETSGFRSHLLLRYLPNDKGDMNTADLPGQNHEYPEGDWETRNRIARRHREHALGLLYFLQNDRAVPEDVQSEAREWGLAMDEFEDNDNFPWQFYVREARRLEGRYMFTENDARLVQDLERTPIHDDAIAIAEYPLDSHACSPERQIGSMPEGNFYASQVTRPSQVPYRSLLPKGVDNLLVPVPLSATHVAYGTIRLEPTWMHIGESAGVAASLAVERGKPLPAIDTERLQRRLLQQRTMVTFFNEFDMADDHRWIRAVQYLGTKGFFGRYSADPDDPLDEATASVWAETASQLLDGSLDPTERARALPESRTEPIDAGTFRNHLSCNLSMGAPTPDSIGIAESDIVSRGEAARLVYNLITSES